MYRLANQDVVDLGFNKVFLSWVVSCSITI
nr:MAG TPA: hypothetical protein [Caudoviricetes sp.]